MKSFGALGRAATADGVLDRKEIDEALGVTTYMGGGPSLMYAASAITAFEEFSRPAPR